MIRHFSLRWLGRKIQLKTANSDAKIAKNTNKIKTILSNEPNNNIVTNIDQINNIAKIVILKGLLTLGLFVCLLSNNTSNAKLVLLSFP